MPKKTCTPILLVKIMITYLPDFHTKKEKINDFSLEEEKQFFSPYFVFGPEYMNE